MTELRGKVPIVAIAKESGYNRYSISRWLEGSVEPRLPQFLHLIEVMSRRLLDFLACCTDPSRLPCVARDHERLELARRTAYEQPWSHAVLRARELASAPRSDQLPWLVERLGAAQAEIAVHLEYVRAMQAIIAASQPGECVGLCCAQLLDLAQSQNALADS